MKTIANNQKGFTLLEIIVVLAVLGALAAMLTPVVFRYIDDANRTRAQNDASAIAAGINQMYTHTGRYAFYQAARGAGALAYVADTDAALLSSNDACDTGDTDLATCDNTAPAVGASTGWAATGKADSLTNQLIENTPAYATTGPRRWRGPYLDAIPALDPWGRSYLVNISKADPNDSTPEAVFVLSAGANGIIETNGNTLATANATVGGDDVIARVR